MSRLNCATRSSSLMARGFLCLRQRNAGYANTNSCRTVQRARRYVPVSYHKLSYRWHAAHMSLEASESHPFKGFSQGSHTLNVPMQLHKDVRQRVVDIARANVQPGSDPSGSFILLQGGTADHRHATDIEPVFRQESYFHYLFGVGEEQCIGAIDLATGCSYLFVPRLPDEYAVWMGEIRSLEHFKAKYEVDEVHYTDEFTSVLKGLASRLLVLRGENTDSGRQVSPPPCLDLLPHAKVDSVTLFPAINECRVHKSASELEVMAYVNRISSAAHVEVMRACKPGMMEYQLESLFQHEVYSKGGCRHVAYTSICASGENSAVLHYGHAGAPNNRCMQEGDLVLLDMGAEYHCYASDITCTLPVSGRFSIDQRLVYEGVLRAHTAVIAAMAPGVAWPDMHLLAERHILQALLEGGILRGELEDLVQHRVAAIFMPHGLGHLLGIDTHDVGGYPKDGPARRTEPGLKSLRTARVLEEGMVITVEPGCYFNKYLLHKAEADPVIAQFFIWEAVKRCIPMGGVRIEDNVVVTSSGSRSLTNVPRTVEEIEAVMSGASWPHSG
ncbi:hypothetical protein CYMTET_10270 [Cymbomonas tetramitiformis]|uniref:Xaa-Pro dipeptidase n=1 Tax=Cymbomonas tetramitiformis TaxID=36881 RepID=A0AAE0LEN2_9CHLO|nr:hypothetical protein CYMTET_10270 [Cymbomonas tetramitiformis]